MLKTVSTIICTLLLMFAFIGCANQKTIIDSNAIMIGESIKITEDTELEVMVVIESDGSDFARANKGHSFKIIKIRFVNNSDDVIELKESDFKVIADDQEFIPISGKLNFVLDKMKEIEKVEPNSTFIAKIVCMTPTNSKLTTMEFTPSFAPNEVKMFNLNEA